MSGILQRKNQRTFGSDCKIKEDNFIVTSIEVMVVDKAFLDG